MFNQNKYTPKYLLSIIPEIFDIAKKSKTLDEFRRKIIEYVYNMQYEYFCDYESFSEGTIIRVRDCAQVINLIFNRRSEEKADFSVAQAIFDIAYDKERPDLKPAFYADILHIFIGLQGKGYRTRFADYHLIPSDMEGREAAIERSMQLDTLSEDVTKQTDKYSDGLSQESIERRKNRREYICNAMQVSLFDWFNWRWQFENVLKDIEKIEKLVKLSPNQTDAIIKAKKAKIPFGITPYYLSLMDYDYEEGRDRAIRAQVIPPETYVKQMSIYSQKERSCLDFMRETDTSPINLITRRYPSICILKPFNTCPQICVYCQRNWEIDDVMTKTALASEEQIDNALKWIKNHPAIREVLITGGDPLGMPDSDFERILAGVSGIPSVERIRIGTRTIVTAPMRITDDLVDILAKYRIPGKRQIAVVTHVQHPYELTIEMVNAVEKLRIRGISVFNQLVYTFFISRRFEAYLLRKNLAKIGIEPYYSFNTKGKDETVEYRVPIARLLQEQKEEARLLPGIDRTDEAVYNVPGMGKNYLRARQHHDLISILPDGTRLYEFHPWEKNITKNISTHIGNDVPILDYLCRLDAIGEDVYDYETIWYYF
ncbi:MAG: KamA family radical SAM protein [Desulfobacterales bacterium]|nr:KamA family radical SAM protein [Desulfobacterales bacterium]MBF0398040.1 KamA family radical SAM protein [Desulfobacterales bacterium]